MDWTALPCLALKSLIAELPIDYIPPFRGNAIRVIDRSRKPHHLKIDFATLEKRKQNEYAKLERMVQYCRSRQCRRSHILEYFGERNARSIHCGGCDNCVPAGQLTLAAPARTPIDTPGGQEILLKILSGVARTKGRFGKIAIAQMLSGSSSERMTRWKLDQLTTFGILRDCGFTRNELAEIIDALAGAGLVQTQDVDRYKPVVILTDSGWSWLRSKERDGLTLDLPDYLVGKLRRGGNAVRDPEDLPERVPGSRSQQAGPSLPGVAPDPGSTANPEIESDPLWHRLKALRSDLAHELKQPTYCIFSNETIDALVRDRPTTPAALAGIKGLGRSRIERHGEAILRAVADFPQAGPAPLLLKPEPAEMQDPGGAHREPRDPDPPAASAVLTGPAASHSTSVRSPDYVATEEWTSRLIDKGFSIAEAAAIRGLDPPMIVRHLTWMVRRGYRLSMEMILPLETISSWDAWRLEHGETAPSEPRDSLHLWPLYLACRRVQVPR